MQCAITGCQVIGWLKNIGLWDIFSQNIGQNRTNMIK